MLGDGSMRDAMRDFQRELIVSRLELHGGSVKAARESLGLTKSTFHRYMKGLGDFGQRWRKRGLIATTCLSLRSI